MVVLFRDMFVVLRYVFNGADYQILCETYSCPLTVGTIAEACLDKDAWNLCKNGARKLVFGAKRTGAGNWPKDLLCQDLKSFWTKLFYMRRILDI